MCYVSPISQTAGAKPKELPMKELILSSAKTIARAIRENRASSREVVKACVERIEQVNPRLNAVVQMDAERALKEAERLDEEQAGGRVRGPLHGVPMTIKDNLDTAGMVSTGGTKGRAGFVPDKDATVVKRLRAAGAVLIGKTNTPELTLAYETDNLIYGRTNNPYDLARTCGGSSGGAAAIVAAGGVPFDIGSDTGGSIRLPAHYCGIAGIRPTSGLVPRTGHILPPAGATDRLTQLGPMSRHVEDLPLILSIIAGMDWQDPAVVPMPLKDPHAVQLEQLRVVFHTDNGVVTPTAEIQAAAGSAADALADAGARVSQGCPDGLAEASELYFGILVGDGAAWIENLLESYGTTEPHPWIQGLIEMARDNKLSTAQYTDLLSAWDSFHSRMLSFMEPYDLLISPPNAFPALRHGEAMDQVPAFSYTFLYNLLGWPGAVVRVGTSPEGLPIGVLIVGQPWGEHHALRVAAFLEERFGGWQMPGEQES
jgi:amidase